MARAVSLTGKGDLAQDTLGLFFTADESLLEAEVELRRVPAPSGWAGAITLGFDHQSRNRTDLAAVLETRMSSASPWVGLEIGRPVSGRLSLSVGGSITAYGPTSALPDPAGLGPVYQAYLAPEIDIYGRSAHPTAVSILARYRTSGSGSLWVAARAEHLGPSGAPLSGFSPAGSRSAVALSFGVSALP